MNFDANLLFLCIALATALVTFACIASYAVTNLCARIRTYRTARASYRMLTNYRALDYLHSARLQRTRY